MATLIRASGETLEVTPANGKEFTLAELQRFVGGFIELIPAPGGRLMFLDEDGKRNRKPVNAAATAIVRHWLASDDEIVGDVILCSRAEAT